MTARVAGPRKPSSAKAAAAPPRPSSAKAASTTGGSGKAPAGRAPAAKTSVATRTPPTPGGPRSGSGGGSRKKPPAKKAAAGSKSAKGPSLNQRLQGPAAYRNWLGTKAPTRTPRQAKAHAVASSLLGLCTYAMFINGVRYGPSGVTGWLKAKFLNRPMQGLSVVTAPNQPVTKPTGPVNT